MKKNKGKFVFNKQKAKAAIADPRPSEQDEEVDLDKLNRDAVKSLHFLPDVAKTDEEFEVV